MTPEEDGRSFRAAWIDGVTKHFPGEPKLSYIAPWEEMADWERDSAAGVYALVRQFVLDTGSATAKLSREQRGRFVALCWLGYVYKHFPEPKPSYVADYNDLPEWQRETDADIFACVQRDLAQNRSP